MASDMTILQASLALYVAAALAGVFSVVKKQAAMRLPLGLLTAALILHTAAIALRWQRMDHGPYVDMYEILSSNIWSLHFAALLFTLMIPRIRSVLAVVLPILLVLVFWLPTVTPSDAAAPVTYDTPWLPLHVGLGKFFLACVLMAVGLSLVVLLRRYANREFSLLPANASLEELAYRFVLTAFIFETLMLVIGAVWAQDAWGRYWDWDPLETWAFVTWLAAAAYLHLRATQRLSQVFQAMMILGIFALAFATFFGTPFISTAPHKGAI